MIAQELEAEPEFAQARQLLYTHALDRAEAAVMQTIDVCAERAQREPRDLPQGDSGISVHDKGSEYARALADLYRSILQRRKDTKPDTDKREPVEIVVRVAGEKSE